MASSIASDRPDLSAPVDNTNDPFVSSSSTGPSHVRFSNFDQELFAAGPGSSPRQAKRALAAHLAETDRRLDEAGKLGTALVSQRKALAEQLTEIEKLQAEEELTPDLRRKLVDIEKEYNDLARESARVFLPKQRVPSNETQGSPYMPDGRSGRRSVSPSKFESQATGSPTKLSVPNRKIRNQPSNRVHDIEFAAEISTSLIAQVRNLQALLAEREEQVKDLRNDVSRLEGESEAMQQRLKILDESEHRFKEENWNLQTRLQEMTGQQREASDREKKLDVSLHTANAAKAATQKELDEVKLSHSKLAEEHAAATKHHDIELGTAKRTIAMAEGERAAMQRKIDDLASQNQELAKAVNAQRARTTDRESVAGVSDDDFETAADNVTPEHSPPASPVKGLTPRHSVLETETLKTSLQHAQRTIQSQRSQLHREKTEKLELRRIIQDLRDDLEKTRIDADKGGAPVVRRGRRVESKEIKAKPPRLLGNFRSSRQEVVVMDDPDWEDAAHDLSPRTSGTRLIPASRQRQESQGAPIRESIETSDQFETANEGDHSAFETAHERATETEDFQTGNEDLSDSDAATEIISSSRGFGGMRRPPSLQPTLSRYSQREASFDSTASTSADDDDFADLRTPTTAVAQRRIRISRGPHSRNSRQVSEEPTYGASPASSFITVNHAPQGQSLYAELQDFGSDDESIVYTPGRRSARSMTPGSTRRAMSPPPAVPELPKVIMVDSSVMTDPVEFVAEPGVDHRSSRASFLSGTDAAKRPQSSDSVVAPPGFRASNSWLSVDDASSSRPLSTLSYSDAGAQYDIYEKLAQFPLPPTSSAMVVPPTPPSLNLSVIQSEHIEPLEGHSELPSPPALSMTPIIIEVVEPLADPENPPPTLNLSTIVAEQLEPKAEPEIPPTPLSFSSIVAEGLEPREEPEILPPMLSLSNIAAENLEPIPEPENPPPALSLSAIATEGSEPIPEPEVPLPSLTLSPILAEGLEPIAEPEVSPPVFTVMPMVSSVVDPIAHAEPHEALATRELASVTPILPELGVSSVNAHQLEPVHEPEAAVSLPSLTLSTIYAEHLEPIEEPVVVVPKPSLDFSVIAAEHLEPIPEPALLPPPLAFSTIATENVEPISEPALLPPPLAFSTIATEGVEPISEPALLPPPMAFSTIATEDVEPISEPALLPPPMALSTIAMEDIEPISELAMLPPALAFSSLSTQYTQPIEELPPALPILGYSSILAEHVQPVSPQVEVPVIPRFGMSSIESVDTHPIPPRSPKRDGFILPRDMKSPFIDEAFDVPSSNLFAPFLGQKKNIDTSTIIAEDDTRQSPSDLPQFDTPDSRGPFQELSANVNARAPRKLYSETSDQGAQTSLTSGAIDQLLKTNTRRRGKSPSVSSIGSPDTAGTVKIYRSQDGVESPAPTPKGKSVDKLPFESTAFRRPGSAASARSSLVEAPPLPPNHQQMIQAARSGSSSGTQTQGLMGPPLWPASATKNRPRTPSQHRPMSPVSGRGTPTPKAVARAGSSHGHVEVQSAGKTAAISRQSSVSSFVSEIDNRFNIRPNELDPAGFGPNTDPRMIQAITQTMIGEYLWKYTRKPGRGELSEKRHRRYFWVHPYTRMIYWSDRDPSTAGRSELKAKSLSIEGVRVVTDDNPMPPGLHRKSLVIISPGRTIKFTCTTGQRHETWFNALSYLLMRTSQDAHSEMEELTDNLTREDIEEFNPQFGRRAANGTRPSAPSLSSYNSRATRNETNVEGISLDIPTLNPAAKYSTATSKSSVGSLSSRIGGYLRSGGPKLSGTLRSKTSSAQNVGIYEASEVHDSAEDLREIIERQDRDADRLENVRACCDGKHDVGSLPHMTKRSRSHNHHSHPLQTHSTLSTPMASMRSRA